MADDKKPRNHTPYQEKIIKRYYSSQSSILLERLAELVGELYLAEGKKKERAWKNAAAAMEKLEVPATRVAHLLKLQNPALVAELVKELEAKK